MIKFLRSLSLRWRLALLSAGLTFAVLCVFALAIGQLTVDRIRDDFRGELRSSVVNLAQQLTITYRYGRANIDPATVQAYAASSSAVIRVVAPGGQVIAQTRNAPDFTRMGLPLGETGEVGGYRVETRLTRLYSTVDPRLSQRVYIQYARPTATVEATVARVRLFLLLGVLAASAVALALAHALSERALAPLSRLTSTARTIARTADPNRRVPVPDTEDEVAELARTLDDMLQALESSRAEREAVLEHQRQFIADASHELRTPLTSVLANLELLADALEGEAGDAARSALRSTQRMRHLVADLLLLARADARRTTPHRPVDLGQIVVDAAAELGPISSDHEVTVSAPSTTIVGAQDELHRMVSNLLENSLRHTPAGTHVSATLQADDKEVRLIVADDGPGVPEELRDRVFERFVRAGGDRAGSTGLGLAIVKTVARAHGGDVRLESPPEGGARFVVTLPLSGAPEPAEQPTPAQA